MTRTEVILAFATLVVGAPGFWQYFVGPFIDRHRKKKSPQDRAMIGLLHEDLWNVGVYYRKRHQETGKGISQARYKYIDEYLYGPYKDLGGNADAEDIMADLHSLIDEQ